jgi:hypothetical protein
MIKGRIYSIRSPNTDKIYIGSTTMTLAKRIYQHKKRLNCSSIEIINMGDAYIELLENYECKDKNELHRREGELQRQYKDICINKKIEGRNATEYKQTDNYAISQNKYRKSDKNKENQKRYKKKSDNYKKYQKEYKKMDKYKKDQQEYKKTDKYKKGQQEYMKIYNNLYNKSKKMYKIMKFNPLPYLLKLHEIDKFFNSVF